VINLKKAAVLLAGLFVGACATTPISLDTTITGAVRTQTPLTLPRDARLKLLLVDVRATEASPEPVAEKSVVAPAHFPIVFELPYDAERITPDGDYRLIVQITYSDAVWYSNVLRPRRVLAPGASTKGVEVAVKKDGVLR
jgi:uncharacterized lipoprotein YbaY